MKKALVFITILLVISVSSCAEDKVPVTRSQCNDLKGNKLWESSTTTVPIADKPGHFLLTEEGKGSYSGFKGFTSNKSEFEFISGGKRLEPVHLKRQVFSDVGKVIFEETQTFDNAEGRVECEIKHLLKKENKKKMFSYKGDIVNRFMMGSYIRRFLQAGEKEKTTYLVNDEPALYRVTLKVLGREEITVNGKKRGAYKICIDPQIGLLSPVKALLPKNYDWHSARPPYEWLMFRGLESSINSPKVEIISEVCE